MIRLKELPLPATIRAFTVPDVDGDYDIIINADLCDAAKLRAFRHEITHIVNDDFSHESADEVEIKRHEAT